MAKMNEEVSLTEDLPSKSANIEDPSEVQLVCTAAPVKLPRTTPSPYYSSDPAMVSVLDAVEAARDSLCYCRPDTQAAFALLESVLSYRFRYDQSEAVRICQVAAYLIGRMAGHVPPILRAHAKQASHVAAFQVTAGNSGNSIYR